MAHKDSRIKLVNEILNGIKVRNTAPTVSVSVETHSEPSRVKLKLLTECPENGVSTFSVR